MKSLILLSLCLFSTQFALAQDKHPAESYSIAILPPVVKTEGTRKNSFGESQDKFNPMDSVKRIFPRLTAEGKKKKWPLEFSESEKTQDAFLAVMGASHTDKDDIKFNQLKPIADKLAVRYVVRYIITELASYRKSNTFLRTATARASITLYVYDHDTNEYVWQADRNDESSAGDFGGGGSLSKRQDQALLNAVSRALEPFAKGERKKIGRPKSDIIASIQKLLGDGKKVLIDVGSDKNVSEGDVFTSIESDAEIKIVKVLSNGSIAEVIKGMPKEKETFKSQD